VHGRHPCWRPSWAPGIALPPHRLTALMPIDARCVHAVPLMPVEPAVNGAQWRAWCGTLGKTSRHMAASNTPSRGVPIAEQLCGCSMTRRNGRRGVDSVFAVHLCRRWRDTSRWLFAQGAISRAGLWRLMRPGRASLSGRLAAQACFNSSGLASVKSAVTAPIPSSTQFSPGVDIRFLYLSLRTRSASLLAES